MNILDDLFDEKFKFFGLCIGEVTNDSHPRKDNQVQVKIVGLNHESDDQSQLIWSRVASGLMFGSNKKRAGVHSLPSKGSFVYIQFLLGDPNEPVVIGAVNDSKSGSKEFRGEGSADINQTRSGSVLTKETAPMMGKYPDIISIEGSGYSFILDDTEGKPQIKQQIEDGSYHELRPGLYQVKTVGDYNTFSEDKYTYVSGGHLEESNTRTIKAEDTILLDCVDLTINAKTITMNTKTITMNAAAAVDIKSPLSKFSGAVTIANTLTVQKTITAAVDVVAGIISLLAHTHETTKKHKATGLPQLKLPWS